MRGFWQACQDCQACNGAGEQAGKKACKVTRVTYNQGMLPTVIETETFRRRAEKLLTLDEREEISVMLAQNPNAGVVVPGSEGARKVRWAVAGRGKSGGVRVIYVHVTEEGVILLMNVYAKNERENMPGFEIRKQKRSLKK